MDENLTPWAPWVTPNNDNQAVAGSSKAYYNIEGGDVEVKRNKDEDDVTTLSPKVGDPDDELQFILDVLEEDEVEPISSGELPPLKNPVILTHLFQICPLPLLANFRLVCKQWRDLSLVSWRSSLLLTFRSNTTTKGLPWLSVALGATHEVISINSKTTLPEFLQFAEDPENDLHTKPFRKIKFMSMDLDPTQEILSQFWRNVGAHLNTLELTECTFPNMDEFRKLIYTTCPKLQNLTVRWCRFKSAPSPDLDDEEVEYKAPVYGEHPYVKSLTIYTLRTKQRWVIPIPWLELLSHFPSLAHLLYENIEDDTNEVEINRLLNAIKIIRKHDGRKLPFKSFVLHPVPRISEDRNTHEKFFLLKQLRIPILHLDVWIHKEFDQAFTNNVVESHADSMNSIRALQFSGSGINWRLPCQVQLERLKTIILCDTLAENMDFLKVTPNLEYLGFRFADHEDDRFAPLMSFFALTSIPAYKPTRMISNSSMTELEHVKLLKLDGLQIQYLVTKNDLANLIKWMPNITKLEMVLNDEQFSLVCDHWRKLKEFRVYGDNLTDKGLIGRTYFDVAVNLYYQREANTNETLPNITYLQDLEHFSFPARQITEDSVFHGFLKLPKLKRLLTDRHVKQLDTEPVWKWNKESFSRGIQET